MVERGGEGLTLSEQTALCPAGVSLIGVCMGILCGYVGCGVGVLWLTGVVMGVVIGGVEWIGKGKRDWVLRMRWVYEVALMGLCFVVGHWAWLLFSPADEVASEGEYGYAVARVNDFRSWSGGDVLEVEVVCFCGVDGSFGRVNSPLRVLVYTGAGGVRRGDLVCFRNRLRRIEAADEAGGRYVRGMFSRGFAWRDDLGGEDLRVVGRDVTLRNRAADLRDEIVVGIERTALSERTRGFLEALLLGDRGQLDGGVYESFSLAGIAHVLALSGMHLGMVVAVMMVFLWPLKRVLGKRMRRVLLLVGVWMFVVLTGMSVSVVRAAVMMSLFLVGSVLGRGRTGGNSLCLAGVLILVGDPVALFSVGFQMSFVACGGLLVLSGYMERVSDRQFERRWVLLTSDYGKRHPRLTWWRIAAEEGVQKLCGVCLVAVVAFGTTWVLTGYYFGRISWMFLPANVVAGVLVWAIFVVSGVYLALYGVGITPGFLGDILDGLCDLLVRCAEVPSEFGWGVTGVSLPWEGVVMYLGALLLLLEWKVSGRKEWLWCGVAMLGLGVAAVAMG